MSEPTLRRAWSPKDYDDTVRDAAKHRALPGIPESVQEATGAQWIPIHTAEEKQDREIVADLLGPAGRKFITDDRGGSYHYQLGTVEDAPWWGPGLVPETVDGEHRVLSCTVAGRHRVRPDPWRRVRRLRAVIAVAVVVLVMALGALWASSRAHAEVIDLCPSGVSGVASPATTCGFADNVRSAFYGQPGWTVLAYSPATRGVYVMTCGHAVTGNGWWDPKRCIGTGAGSSALVVYIA
jgi:hypothetical protein